MQNININFRLKLAWNACPLRAFHKSYIFLPFWNDLYFEFNLKAILSHVLFYSDRKKQQHRWAKMLRKGCHFQVNFEGKTLLAGEDLTLNQQKKAMYFKTGTLIFVVLLA